MNRDILIIPDVHGRSFWKDAVDREPWATIVFLGDYVDPYSRDNIDERQSLENFQEILEYARSHDNVVMLLGNHDLHYYSVLFFKHALSSRFSFRMADILRQLFVTNKELFSLAYETTFNGHHYLLTHSGVCNAWLDNNRDVIGSPDAEHLNHLLDSDEGILSLAQVSKKRGGFHPSGSIVWGDVEEMLSDHALPDVYQIFGHTQQSVSPIITDQMACLDVRRAFVLREGSASIRPAELDAIRRHY